MITIKNETGRVAVVEIEGIIGVPEHWQFDEPGERVATYDTFRARVEAIAQVQAPEVVVDIRSTGGSVADALLIHDALMQLSGRVTTRCYGYVASAATIIAQAASEGCRQISRSALYLIHNSMCAVEGNTSELQQTMQMLEVTDQRIAQIYASRSGRELANFEALMAENSGNGRWLSPDEVVELGLADTVITPAAAAVESRWNTVLDMLGIGRRPEPEALFPDEAMPPVRETPADMNEITAAHNRQMEEAAAAHARALQELAAAHAEREAALQNRIEQLEALTVRLSVGATVTQPKEDPSPQTISRSANDDAYAQDARNFR